ncbi:hypothetical protein HMSSN139_10580 [Paenibacillus sp. HMSSN-139]|nr:hypothetical protein HMSSN139_10580 [Paenibacillus sp. HMSSN-139]
MRRKRWPTRGARFCVSFGNGGGRPLYRTGAPLTAPLEPFVRYAYRWAFEHWERPVWQEFDWNGIRVGAPAFIVNVTQSPNYPGPVSEREIRSIWNQAWFSSLRSAAGVFRYGRQQDDPNLLRRARLMKELALSAPQRSGFFPSVIATEMEQVQLGDALVHRSKGWDTAYWGNSDRNPLPDRRIKEAPYHIADMSWTALWMLRWYGELERDPRLLAYAVRYGDALIAIQDAQGFSRLGWIGIPWNRSKRCGIRRKRRCPSRFCSSLA